MRLRSGTVLTPTQDVTGNVNDSVTVPYDEATSSTDASLSLANEDPEINLNMEIDPSPISKCGKCVTCNKGFLDTNPHFINHLTGEEFIVTENMTCKSTNILYLIRCAHPDCFMQYVGQSINSVNTRCI